jgi:hypothetical protein
MDLTEKGWGCMDSIDLAQNKGLWWVLVNDNEPLVSINCLEVLE